MIAGITMATAVAGSLPAVTVTPPTVITDDQRRWVVIGICLNKLLTPLLRNLLAKEMLGWYNLLCLPSSKQINNQTYKKETKTLPPSTIKLNYGNINKNYDNHKLTYNAYDYNVKDPESLAKLFVQPFMAKFSGFNQTMDLSAVLTVMCEADPFHTSGAAAQANTVRSVVRNEWAHCNFSHWSDANYLSCIQHIETLVKKLNLPSADENNFLKELNNWKDKGNFLCIIYLHLFSAENFPDLRGTFIQKIFTENLILTRLIYLLTNQIRTDPVGDSAVVVVEIKL